MDIGTVKSWMRWIFPPLIALALLLVFLLAPPGSAWYLFPLLFGPFLGAVMIFLFLRELSKMASFIREEKGPGWSGPLFFVVLSYLMLVFVFAVGYAAGTKRLSGQLLSASNQYECVSNLGCSWIEEIGLLVYYSLISASTVGYGDFVPTGSLRFLACVHVVEFWLLIVVSVTYFQTYASLVVDKCLLRPE